MWCNTNQILSCIVRLVITSIYLYFSCFCSLNELLGTTMTVVFALFVVMQNNNTIMLSPKPKNETLPAPQRFECDIIDGWMSLQGHGRNNNYLDTGYFVVKTLQHTLWYIDHVHKFKHYACPLPKTFTQFSGYNDYKKLHHKRPVIAYKDLNDFLLDFTKALLFHLMFLSRHKELHVSKFRIAVGRHL